METTDAGGESLDWREFLAACDGWRVMLHTCGRQSRHRVITLMRDPEPIDLPLAEMLYIQIGDRFKRLT